MMLKDKMLAVMDEVNAEVVEREKLVQFIAIALLTHRCAAFLAPDQKCNSDWTSQCARTSRGVVGDPSPRPPPRRTTASIHNENGDRLIAQKLWKAGAYGGGSPTRRP